MQVNKEMIIAQLIQVDPGIVEILFAAGMHCIGCPSAQGESLEMACMVHGIDADELVNQIKVSEVSLLRWMNFIRNS